MIPDYDKTFLKEIQQLLSKAKNIVITTHYNPDGDAIGSMLALYNYLVKKKYPVTCIAPNRFPGFLNWMPGSQEIMKYEEQKQECEKLLSSADVIFCLDFNDPKRVEVMTDALLKSPAVKILIDHHLEPKDFCQYTFSFSTSCATCELIYHFIDQSGDKKMIDESVGECLYCGIMTDTGSFRFSSMTADTHRVIAELMESGVKNYKVHENISDDYTEERMRFLGYCLKDKLKIFPEFKTALIALSKKEMESYHNQPGDTEGVVNYALGIRGIRLAALFTEREGKIKISFRSKGTFSAKDIAVTYFDGGGHRNAAGGSSNLSLEDTVAKFVALLPQYKDAFEN